MTTRELVDALLRQHEIAWALCSYHLDGLTTEACLWRPADRGPHVAPDAAGVWRADWPEHEGYDLGPPSGAWITWHMQFWWSMALDHTFGDARLDRAQVPWAGSAEAACASIRALHDQWVERVGALTDEDLRATTRTRWPFADKPLADLIGWLNVELSKNAAELGYVRFCHARRS